MNTLTKTVEIKNHILHLDMVLPNDFKAKKVRITITEEEEEEPIIENPIMNLRGKLNFSKKQYKEIQEFLNEDR
jgi:hypothetical protein